MHRLHEIHIYLRLVLGIHTAILRVIPPHPIIQLIPQPLLHRQDLGMDTRLINQA